jgi:NitT/TauT family transport system substrate-binding protein
MNENTVSAKPEWTQKVMNAIVKAEIYAQNHKKEVAHMLSKDGKKYLPMPGKVVERAMTTYDTTTYAEPNAIHNADWGTGRIDFSPWPYPSATEFIVDSMNKTVVSGDKTFLSSLDPKFVAKDLVDYNHVKVAMEKHKGWETAPGIDANDPFNREEVIDL